MTHKTEITNINKTEAPNSFSFRWGKVGDEVKIYFNDLDDLIAKLKRISVAIELAEKAREPKE